MAHSSPFLNALLLIVLWFLGLQTWWSVDARSLKQTVLLVVFQVCAGVTTSTTTVFLTCVCLQILSRTICLFTVHIMYYVRVIEAI